MSPSMHSSKQRAKPVKMPGRSERIAKKKEARLARSAAPEVIETVAVKKLLDATEVGLVGLDSKLHSSRLKLENNVRSNLISGEKRWHATRRWLKRELVALRLMNRKVDAAIGTAKVRSHILKMDLFDTIGACSESINKARSKVTSMRLKVAYTTNKTIEGLDRAFVEFRNRIQQ